MPKKRESRQKSRQSVAIRSVNGPEKGDHDTVVHEFGIGPFRTTESINQDADTLRRVREWAETEMKNTTRTGVFCGRRDAAGDVLAILNGTERKETKR